MKLNLGQDSEARFGLCARSIFWISSLVKILKLMLGRYSEDEI